MRTTLDIDDTLLSLARERARARKMTLTAFVEAALAAATAPVDESPAPFRLNLPIERGTYIGGVDLADRDALYDRMEGPALIAVDTNVLVYARRAESPLHVSAVAVLRDLAEGLSPWGIPIFCVTEFFRVVTHPRLFEPPSSPDGAIAFIAALLASPTARLLLPGPRYWHVFQELVADGSITGNLAFDAQIAAVCVENGAGELITEDRDFNRFSGLRTRRLA